jgi:glycerol-1-phosphate dehydrogenase [NAD(P)+]
MQKFDPENLDQLKENLSKTDEKLSPVLISDIIIKKDAINDLQQVAGKIINEFRNKDDVKILLVTDNTKIFAGGKNIKDQVIKILKKTGISLDVIIFRHEESTGGTVHADIKNVETVKNKLKPGTILISLGSGTVTDISKHAAYTFSKENNAPRIPFIVVQTANTVTAFTSNIAVLFKDGVKRTFPSRYPDYVFSDINILKEAPEKLTLAGYGDLLARYVSYADWYLGYRLKNLDKYSQVPKELLDGYLDYLLLNAAKIKKGDEDAFAMLTKALLNAGISMSVVNMSTPISGYEHVISHVLDMLAAAKNGKSEMHGIQVALATVMSAYLYEYLINDFDIIAVPFESFFPAKNIMEDIIRTNFLEKGLNIENINEILNDYSIKYKRWNDAESGVKKFIDNWEDEKKILKSLTLEGDKLKKALLEAGMSFNLNHFDPEIDLKDLKFAFLNAPYIRRRFTVGDLFALCGELKEETFRRVYSRLQRGTTGA